jgi:hypothetical protein
VAKPSLIHPLGQETAALPVFDFDTPDIAILAPPFVRPLGQDTAALAVFDFYASAVSVLADAFGQIGSAIFMTR